jgi:bla regulator protein blaR1
MIPANWISALANHLWQSTAFAALAWLLALALRKNQARARYWIWLCASLKFLVPFSLLFAIGTALRPAVAAPITRADVSTAMTQVAQPFSLETPVGLLLNSASGAVQRRSVLPIALAALWVCGFVAVAFCWLRKWWRVRVAFRAASPFSLRPGTMVPNVPVMASRVLIEPGIFGIFRPVLMLPVGIADRLTPSQMDAIVGHEMCHVRRRDNLTAAIHMFVEAVFWFHPLVWWIGTKMVEERERACDEAVLQRGGDPEIYAEGILSVCKFYTESPVACVAGVSGSDLKKRIVRIMTEQLGHNLTFARKTILGLAGMVAVAAPLAFGILNAPLLRAQAAQVAQAQDANAAAAPSFEVASIKPDDSGTPNHLFQQPGPGRMHTTNISARMLVAFAYGLKDFQLMGGPAWSSSQGYVIDAKMDDAAAAQVKNLSREQQRQQMQLMLRSLLADRFKLTLSHETKDLPIYALVVAKGGPKLTPTAYTPPDPNAPNPALPPQNGSHLMLSRGKIDAVNQTISGLAGLLALVPDLGDRIVEDETGITGNYDFTIHFSMQSLAPKGGAPLPDANAPAADDTSEPSIFTALEEQLGLKLESTKGPVDVYTIEHIEQPTEN